MSDPDNFLARWSRKKLEPKADDSRPQSQSAPPVDAESAAGKPAAIAPQDPPAEEPAFDITTLPPIESITAGTDIRDFLRPGVPLSLSRAALRRAWTSDPTIRDFVGLAENQWDFTAPDSIPGFGPLDPKDIPDLLAKIIGSEKDKADIATAAGSEPSETPQPDASEMAVAKGPADESETAARGDAPEQPASDETRESDPSHRNKNVAAQKEESEPSLNYAQARNGHGSALPN